MQWSVASSWCERLAVHELNTSNVKIYFEDKMDARGFTLDRPPSPARLPYSSDKHPKFTLEVRHINAPCSDELHFFFDMGSVECHKSSLSFTNW